MGSQSSASIEIGGPLAKTNLEALVDAIVGQGVQTDDGPDLSDPDQVEQYVLDAIEHGKILSMYDQSASWGNFDYLTAACQELKLVYRHSWDGNYDYGPGVVYWDSSMKPGEPFEGEVSYDGNVMVCFDIVVKKLKDGTWEEYRRRLSLLSDKLPPLKWDE